MAKNGPWLRRGVEGSWVGIQHPGRGEGREEGVFTVEKDRLALVESCSVCCRRQHDGDFVARGVEGISNL